MTLGRLTSQLPRLLIAAGVFAILAWIVVFLPSLVLGDPPNDHSGRNRFIMFLATTGLPGLSAALLLSGSVLGIRQSPSDGYPDGISAGRVAYALVIPFALFIAYFTLRSAITLAWR